MSWWQLVEIAQEAKAWKQWEAERGPIACPNDGEPLIYGPDGVLFCRFDGWRPT